MTQSLDSLDLSVSPLRVASNHLRLAQSSALHEAAENLLDKALRALLDDDATRAEAFVRRALRLPYDDYEECTPAWWRAYMMLFTSITDELEEGPEGEGWLDAALTIEQDGEEYGRRAVQSALSVLVEDYQLSAHENRRIRARLRDAEPRREWQDLLPDDQDDAVTAILQVLAAFNAYDDALEALADS